MKFLTNKAGEHRTVSAFILGVVLVCCVALVHQSHAAVSRNPLARDLASVAGNGLIAPACGSATINTTCQGTSGLLTIWYNFTSCVTPVTLYLSDGRSFNSWTCDGSFQVGGFSDNETFNEYMCYNQVDGTPECDYLNGVWIPVCRQ